MHHHEQPVHQQQTILRISMRSMIFAGFILLLLMTAAGIFTHIITPGNYDREEINGTEMIVEGSFTYTDAEPLPVWRWYTSPFEVLAGDDAPMIIGIALFICLIAGAVHVISRAGMFSYLLQRIIQRFKGNRYKMEAVIIFVLMLFGSVLGTMEEVVVLVPLLTLLAVRMGWDTLTGLGLSLGAIAFGFAAALTNPFTIGVAQRIAGLPVFSGLLYRLIIFTVVYLLYTWYVISLSKKQELVTPGGMFRPDEEMETEASPSSRNALRWLLLWIGIMAVSIFVFSRTETLHTLILPIVIFCFVTGGIGAGLISGLKIPQLAISFLQGAAGIAPGILLILMAASVGYIMRYAGTMDTILFWAEQRIGEAEPYTAVFLMYALVLVLNFFISSGSAKAFLIMPVVTPLADLTGVSRQSAVLAFQFGDGFSNILYPTNALLLICLAITGVSYFQWFKWVWKIQAVFFLLSLLFLFFAVYSGYQ